MPWEPLPGSSDPEPRPLRDGLDRVVRHLGAPSVQAVTDVFGVWEEAVGAQVAAHAVPKSLRDGVLKVTVDDPAWTTQLRFLEPEILGKLRTALGADAPERIELRVAHS
ncbi:MAG: DUF721 domain-containing protein [Acidimicrobiales bacterium]